MKKIAYLVAGCAAVLALPALAQNAPYTPRAEDRPADAAADIGRRIQDLSDSIYAADRQRRISPSQADAYIRELRDIETQLLDVRSRTFGEGSDESGLQPGNPPALRENDPDLIQGDQADAPDPDREPDPRDSEIGAPIIRE